MSNDKSIRPTPAGVYNQSTSGATTGLEWTGLLMAILWLAVSVYITLTAQSGTSELFVSFVGLLMIFMPVAMIWVAVVLIRSSQRMRADNEKLQLAIEALRKAYIDQSKLVGKPASDTTIGRKLDEIAAAQRKTETTLAMFTSTRVAAAQTARATQDDALIDDQPALALGTRAEELSPPLTNEDTIRALNFPETAQDEKGFAALRRALKDRKTSQLIQAAQDILTLLSQDGIYMDDMRPDMARPEVWRRFAKGERGKSMAVLGAIRDRSSLALTSGRMKQDVIFRDAAHHFLRLFDKGLSEFEKNANDSELSALSETRTARAFMLLGRVAGAFD
jgi:hypothetical protein